jgi:hypothetical protein
VGKLEGVHEGGIGVAFPDEQAKRWRRISACGDKEQAEKSGDQKSRALHQSSIRKEPKISQTRI